MKDSDPRLKEWTDWYHEQYRAKYGNPPFWDGKIFKAMPKTMAYFDGIAKDSVGTGLEEMKKAASLYLKSGKSQWILANLHPTMYFLTNPHQFLHEDPPQQQLTPPRVPPPPVAEVFKKQEGTIIPCDMKKFREDYMRNVIKEPIKMLKGFISHGALLKKINPKAWEEARSILKEVVGPERCKEIYLTMKNQGLVSSVDHAIKSKEGSNHDRTIQRPSEGRGQGRMEVVPGARREGEDLGNESARRDEAGKTPELDRENEFRRSREEEIRKCLPGDQDSLRD